MVVAMENRTARCWGNFADDLRGATIDEDIRAIVIGAIGCLRRDNNIADPLEPDIREQSRIELVYRLSFTAFPEPASERRYGLEGVL